jgi:hypothetical protein
MTKGAKIGIIVGVVIILGVGGYFLYKKFTSDGTDSNDDSVDDQKPINESQVQPVSNVSEFPATPFKNKGQGDYFRLWLNRYYPKDSKALDLDKQGDYDNKFIRKAWMKYGVLYKQQVKNWDKIKNAIPASFVAKFEKKDSYNFQILSNGKIALIPKYSYPKSKGFKVYFYSDGNWEHRAVTDMKQKMGSGKWWDSGKQAGFNFPTSIKKNIKADNFYSLAKLIDETINSGAKNFTGSTYRNGLDLENNFVD